MPTDNEPIQVASAPQPEPISVDTGVVVAPITPDIAAQRAFKTRVGLPDFDYAFDDIYASVLNGGEQGMRKEIAAHTDFEKERVRQNIISKITATAPSGKLDPIRVEAINKLLTQKGKTDPESVIEELYAKQVTEGVSKSAEATNDDWKTADPNAKNEYLKRATEHKTWQEFMYKEKEDAEAIAKQQPMTGYLLDRAKEFLVPGYWQVKPRGQVAGVPTFKGFFGENMEEQSRQLMRLPMDQRKVEFKRIMKGLNADNPGMGVAWASAMIGQSSEEKLMNDMFSALDIPIVGALKLGLGVSARVAANKTVADGLKSALKSSSRETASRAAMAEAAGDIKEAGVQEAINDMKKIMDGWKPGGPTSTVNDWVARGRSLYEGLEPAGPVNSTMVNPISDSLKGAQSMFRNILMDSTANVPTYRMEMANRIAERTTEVYNKVIEAVTNTLKVDRTPAIVAVDGAIRRVGKELAEQFPGLNNRYLDSTLRHDPAIPGYFVDNFYGEEGATLFSSQRQAKAFIKTHNLEQNGAEIVPQGSSYAIKMSKPLPETGYAVRDILLELKGTKTPDSWLNAYGGWLGSIRTPEETLSVEQNMARKAVTYGMNRYYEVAKENAKEIQSLRSWALPFTKKREKWNQWVETLDIAKGIKERTTGETKLLNKEEFSNVYMNKWHRLPDEQEVAAYFAYKRGEVIHQVWNNLNAYRDLHRQGAEKISVYTLHVDLATPRTIPTRGVTFNGIAQSIFPGGDSVMVIIGKKLGGEQPLMAKNLKGKYGEQIRDKFAKGEMRVFKVAYPGQRPLEGFGTKIGASRVEYVVVDAAMAKSEKLDWNQIRRRPPEYDHEHFVAQPIIKYDPTSKFHWYEGDRKIAAFNIRAMGNDVVNKLNVIREHLKAGNVAAAQEYYKANPLAMKFEKIHGWFKGDVTSEGLPILPRLDVNVPIHLAPRNKLLIETEASSSLKTQFTDKNGRVTLRDGTKDGYGRYLAGQHDVDDIFTLENSGTKANPLYDVQPAKVLDAYNSINRALNKVINSTFMGDYKIFSIEHWIQEAKKAGVLKASDHELATAPFHHFFNPEYIENVSDVQRLNNLKIARLQIQQFIGMSSPTDTYLHGLAQKLSDSLYESGRTRAALVPAFLLPRLRDPFGFIRSVVFDPKMGFWNPVQLFVQANSMANIIGVAGYKMASPATKAAMLHMWSRFNSHPEILAKLDEYASTRILPGTHEFKPGWFLEGRDILSRTGFEHVAGEVIQLDKPWVDIVHNERQIMLNSGRMFFREAERGVRTAAWYTAFLEHRIANPVGRITDREVRQILNRADTLAVNMSRASASTLHSGIFSIPTQFLSYSLRLGELFMGKRLTQLERARLFTTYSMIYGIPGAFGLTGLPIGDFVHKWAIEDGYDVGKDFVNDMVTNGLPSVMLALATGYGDYSKGNQYNFSERYGTQGFGTIREALRSDKPFLDIIGGAAYSTLSNTIKQSSGFYNAMISMIKQDGEFALKVDDLVDPFLEISTVATAKRYVAALNSAQWVNKHDAYVSDVSKGNALFMTLSGLQPQGTADQNVMHWIKGEEKDAQKEGLKNFIREFRRAAMVQDDNPQQAIDYVKRGLAYLVRGGYPEEEIPTAIALAAKGYESILDRSKIEFLTKHVPESRKPAAAQQLNQFYQSKEK